MNSTWHKNIIAALAICSITSSAMAQYIWLDEKGVKQFSDVAPPASVPKSRILKEAGKASGASHLESATTGNGSSASSPANSAQDTTSLAEKNADFNKRRAEQAEKEKKAAEQAKLAEEKAKNCKQARDYQHALDSGTRVVRTGKNGEKSILSEEERKQEMQQAKRYLSDCS